jgi:hypothetical protein
MLLQHKCKARDITTVQEEQSRGYLWQKILGITAGLHQVVLCSLVRLFAACTLVQAAACPVHVGWSWMAVK